ncbi:MAG TPA: class I SAM-dependent methyltransferase [Solirubrobacteraceae bacterium]
MSDPTRTAYDAFAPAYAQRHAAMIPALVAAADRFLSLLGGAGPVLDLGCGPGRDAAYFAERKLSVVGADFSDGMLALARERARVPLVQCDLRAVPFRDGAFGGVWCDAALLHVPKADVPRALTGVRRVLEHGGALCVLVQQGEGEGVEPLPGRPEIRRFFARYRAREVRRLLADAGFESIAVEVEPAETRVWLHCFARRGA